MKKLLKKNLVGFCCVIFSLQPFLTETVRADFDGDLKADMFIVTATGTLIWREGSLENARDLIDWKLVDNNTDCAAVTVGDFTGDGFMDLMYSRNHSSGGTIVWRRANGNNNGIDWVRNIQSGTHFTDLLMGNFDDDGNTDLIVNQNGVVRWFEYDSGAANQYVSRGDITSGVVGGMVLGNFDNFGGRDLLVAKDSQVVWYEATGNNTFKWIQNFNSLSVGQMVLGDFDGDEEPDLLAIARVDVPSINVVAGDILMYESRIPPNVSNRRLDGRGAIRGTNAVDIALADIDGSGRNTLVVARATGGYRYFVASNGGPSSDFIITEVSGSAYDQGAKSIAFASTSFQPELPCEPGMAMYDINGDCSVDEQDLLVLAQQWLESSNLE